MNNEHRWRAGKFVRAGSRWRASRDLAMVGRGSRIVAELQAQTYYELIQQHAFGDLLDLGCGEVPLYGMYRPLVKSVVCVDWPDSRHETGHADLMADLNIRLELPDSSFDTILCTDVLEHLWRPDQAFSDAARLLRPGGKLILTTPFMYWIHEAPNDYFRYTEFALRRYCELTGFEIVLLEPYGGRWQIFADLLMKWAAASPILSMLVEAVLRPFVLRRMSQGAHRTATRLPLGYSLVARRPAATTP